MHIRGLAAGAAFLAIAGTDPSGSLAAAPGAVQPQSQADKTHAAGEGKDIGAKAHGGGPVIAADPLLRSGRLANGLNYVIRPNHSPAGAISVRLAFNVGSYEEADDELGYAHFIEHMAFRSTRLAPDGILDDRFAHLGVAFGRDENAVTTLQSTVYGVDLPTADLDGLRNVLAWLRSGAEDIVFSPKAVDAERGVVLAELRSRESPISEVQQAVTRFQAPGLRSTRREPIGTESALKLATPARLKSFYDRWYRPENATLVIVGDAPPEVLERLASEALGGWKGRGPVVAPPEPPTSLPDRDADAIAISNAALPAAVSSCRISPKPAPVDTLAEIRRTSLSQIWSGILSVRLKHLAARPGSPLLGTSVLVNRQLPDALGACIVAVPTAGKWKEALSQAQAEFRRFAAAGPTETEVESYIEDLRSLRRAAIIGQSTRNSDDLANQIAGAALQKQLFQSPADALATFELAVSGIKAADVRKAFEAEWSGNGPLLSIISPDAPGKESLLAAWRENEAAAPLEAYADRAAAQWAYKFGKPGKVEHRQLVAQPGFVRLQYRNGTYLNFRQSKLEAGHVDIRVRFGRGMSGLAPGDRGPAGIAAGMFQEGGLGKMDYEQIASVFQNTTWNFTLDIPTTAFVLGSTTLSEQVQDEMKLLAAYMSDPGFRPTIDEKLPTAIDFAYRYLRTNPLMVALDASEQKLFPQFSSLPPRERMEAWRARDMEKLLKPIITRSPIEVTIVGDIDEQQAEKAMAASFGALPRRAPLADAPVQPFKRYPETLPPPITSTHQGSANQAAALLIWPLYVASAERRQEEYALSILASIFQSRLIQRVRVAMGKTYSPTVSTAMPDDADQGILGAALETAPADLDSAVAAAREIASDLASGKISQDEVDKARQPMIAQRLQAQGRNAAWASIISLSTQQPRAVDELLAFPRQIAAVTLDDVRAAAATWLKRDPLVTKALPAATAATGG